MYNEFVTALKATGIPFAEYAWDQRPDQNYGVIAPDGALHFFANQKMQNQAPQGTVDLYAYTNDREDMAAIQTALNAFDGCAWYLNSVQYEQETRIIHWEWVFTLESWLSRGEDDDHRAGGVLLADPGAWGQGRGCDESRGIRGRGRRGTGELGARRPYPAPA
jgi:hypothetical protein